MRPPVRSSTECLRECSNPCLSPRHSHRWEAETLRNHSLRHCSSSDAAAPSREKYRACKPHLSWRCQGGTAEVRPLATLLYLPDRVAGMPCSDRKIHELRGSSQNSDQKIDFPESESPRVVCPSIWSKRKELDWAKKWKN